MPAHLKFDPGDEVPSSEEEYTRQRVNRLTKYKVKYELRSYHEVTVDARTPSEAEDIVCGAAYGRHRQSVYAIEEIEPLEILPEELEIAPVD